MDIGRQQRVIMVEPLDLEEELEKLVRSGHGAEKPRPAQNATVGDDDEFYPTSTS